MTISCFKDIMTLMTIMTIVSNEHHALHDYHDLHYSHDLYGYHDIFMSIMTKRFPNESCATRQMWHLKWLPFLLISSSGQNTIF